MVALHSQAAERKASVRYCDTYSATTEIPFAWYGENDNQSDRTSHMQDILTKKSTVCV
jgi:hypothetical protein